MNKNSHRMAFAVIALTVFCATIAPARTGRESEDKKASTQVAKNELPRTNHDMSKMDMSGMMNEPHHVLAMAYKQTVETFAKALRDQAQGSALSTDFARAAVAGHGLRKGSAQTKGDFGRTRRFGNPGSV